MSDDLERLAGRARDDLTRAVDGAAPSPPPVASVARRAARRRTTHVALAVAAVLTVGSGVVWSAGDDDPSSKVVAGQPQRPRSPEDDNRTLDPASGNRCFRPSYLPSGFAPQLRPGPAMAGGPMVGPRDEVFHWGDGLTSIDVVVADTGHASVPTGGEEHFVVLGGDAAAGRFMDAHGGRYEWVAFAACGRSWVLSATSTDDGRGTPPGQVRRVAEGLVPGDPNQSEPTGVTGILYAYPAADATVTAGGRGPASGRVVALQGQKEVARSVASGNGRFMLDLAPGDYEIVGVLDDGHPCGQQRVTVVKTRVRYVIFTCERPGENPATTVTAAPAGDDVAQRHPKDDPRPCSAAEFPVTARSGQERYTGDEIVRVVYEFTNRSSSPCIFPHQSKMRIVNEAGEVVWQALTTHDCPNVECRHIQPGETRTGGEEWPGTTSGPAPERQRVPDGLYRAELDFEVEDSMSSKAEPLARYHTTTAPFRISSQ